MVLGYIQRVMVATPYAVDFFKLLPESLHYALRRIDRHLLGGDDGLFDDIQAAEFLEKNKKYIHLMKIRMTYNLLDVP